MASQGGYAMQFTRSRILHVFFMSCNTFANLSFIFENYLLNTNNNNQKYSKSIDINVICPR